MKKLALLFCLLFLFSCSKERNTYIIQVEKNGNEECVVEVDNVPYYFTDNKYIKEIYLKKWDVISVSLDYVDESENNMTLSVVHKDKKIATVSGNRYMYVVLSKEEATTGGGGYYNGSNSNGNSNGSSASHLCGAPTKDGTPCKRRVSEPGYCWQHR